MSKAKETDDRIPWSQWQRHDEAAEAYHLTKATGQGGNGNRGGRDTNIIRVKNNSGAARSLGHILEFTGLELSNLDGDVPMLWMTGGSPSLANAFGVLLYPLDDGESGPCQVAGACKALVNVIDASHMFASVSASTYVLQSSAFGPARILYKPSGTGEKKCGIILGDSRWKMLGKTDAAINKGAGGTVSIYSGAAGSETDTGYNVTAYNRFANVAITKWVWVESTGEAIYLTAAEC